jgi:hypothetical protein
LPAAEALTEEELGRRLLALAELAEVAGLDAEASLRTVTVRLRDALIALEQQAAARRADFMALDEGEKRAMWEQWLHSSE